MKDLAQQKFKKRKKISRHFLPCPDTKKRASFLHHKFFIFYSLLFLFFILTINVSKIALPGVLGYSSEIKVTELLNYTNEYRINNNKTPLVINEKLSKAAEEKAKYMFEKDFWAHTSPDGTEPWVFVINSGYDYIYAGENLARNFYSSKDVVDAWIASPTHRDNLISENYDEVGFAVVNGILDGNETALVVQFFGRPKNPNLIASAEEQKLYLESLNETVSTSISANIDNGKVMSAAIDIPSVFRYLAFGVLGFVIALFFFDIYYSKKNNINKFTGHTEAHLLVLVAAVISILIILRNGSIL